MTVLPEVLNCREFVNADEIAKGLSPFNPESMAIEAGKLMLHRINALVNKRVTFAIETTLATRSYNTLVKKAKENGYIVILLFFWLPKPEMAIERVANRVAEGGHNIPVDIIQRRYWAGLRNLFNIFEPIIDSLTIYDNSNNYKPIVIDNRIIDEAKLYKIKHSCQNRKK